MTTTPPDMHRTSSLSWRSLLFSTMVIVHGRLCDGVRHSLVFCRLLLFSFSLSFPPAPGYVSCHLSPPTPTPGQKSARARAIVFPSFVCNAIERN